MTRAGHSAHDDSRSELSHKDIQIYARQLVAATVEESLKAGKYDLDLAFYNEGYQKRIRSELRRIVREFNGISGTTLPPPEGKGPGRPKKEKGQDGEGMESIPTSDL